MRFDLPLPPSVNCMYRSVVIGKAVRVLKSREYRDWLKLAVDRIALERRGQQHIHCSVFVYANLGYVRDLDGLLKPTLDALEAGGAIKDDRYVERLWAERSADEPKGRMHVSLQATEATLCTRCKRGKH